MRQRLDHIDGLRAVAVLSVIAFHAGVHNAATAANPNAAISLVLRDGCHGVDLFFVLSGFCLAYPTLARIRASGRAVFGVGEFAARRLVRILPPYYAAIALLAAAGWLLHAAHFALPDGMSPRALSAAGIARQLLFFDRDRAFLNQSFWTLGIEFRWYVIFPAVLWLWIRSPKAFAVAGAAAVAAGATRLYSVDLFFLPIFMLGVVAADLYACGARVSRTVAMLCLPALLLAAATTARGGWYFEDAGPFWGLAMFTVVVTAGCVPALRALLSWKPLLFVGTASYGIYLVHEPVIIALERWYAASPAPVAFAAAVAGSLAAGVVFSYAAEQPFLKGRLRGVLLSYLAPALRSTFARMGIADSLALHEHRPPPKQAAA